MHLHRLGYINWLWYGWGALMINQYEGSDVKIFGDVAVLDYYSLNGVSKWAFLVYSSLTFVFFFVVCYLVSRPRLSPHRRCRIEEFKCKAIPLLLLVGDGLHCASLKYEGAALPEWMFGLLQALVFMRHQKR